MAIVETRFSSPAFHRSPFDPNRRAQVKIQLKIKVMLVAEKFSRYSFVLAVALNLHGQGRPSSDRLVKFDLASIGARGEPVTDLESGACQVTEDGKREAFAFFHFLGNLRPETTPPTRGEYSNRAGREAHPTIILLDLLSERMLTWMGAGNEIVKAVEHLESSNNLYFYVLTNHGLIYPVHPIPKNRVDFQRDPTAQDWGKQLRIQFERLARLFAGMRPIEDHDAVWRAQLTIRALDQFANELRSIPGRKNLVWISHGVPLFFPGMDGTQVDLTPQVQRLAEVMNRAGIAAYTVAQSAAGVNASIWNESRETLRLVSDLTGGRAYPSNNASTAITEARADLRGLYRMGYFAQRKNGDGKYHKIRVTCARKGIRLQTKMGYWDVPISGDADQQEQTAFQAAENSIFDDPGVGITAVVSPLKTDLPGIRLRIRVDSTDLMPREDYPLTFGIVEYSIDGSAQAYKAAQAAFKAALDGWIELTRDLALDPALESIRIVVLDRGSGETGSLTIRLAGRIEPR